MSVFLVLAAAATLSAPTTRPTPPNPTPGLVNVSRFEDRAMVRPVDAAPCAMGNFTKWPEAGCLRRAEHAPSRK
jgi:hypothetical protein